MKFIESESIELKEIFVPDIKKAVIAFANTTGGTIYVGIRDDGEFCGLEKSDFTMQQIASALRDGIRPEITMFTQMTLVAEDNKTAIRLDVTQGTRKPYYLTDKGLKPSGVYVRQGSTCAPVSEDAIRQMIKQTDGDSFERARSLIQELSFEVFTAEMNLRNLEIGPVQQKNLGILSQDDIYTNLGLLVSDQCLHSIKVARFQGTDKLVFRDRFEFSGSIFSQLNEAYKAIDFYNAKKATFHDLLRKDVRDYPIDAVRESLLNAIIHRDYGFSGSTTINLYSDRLEFISLGGLVPGFSIEAAMLGASQPRNEKLAALFYRMELIEAYGAGISKIMSSYAGTNKKPSFESVSGAFRVTLPNLNFEKSNVSPANDSEQKILSYLKENKSANRRELESHLNLGTTRVLEVINEMKAKKLLQQQGMGRNTRYVLK